ncbi:hypothetical protein [Deinococcus ficus]|nr:hypothetical protein [Deinococcus ficus]
MTAPATIKKTPLQRARDAQQARANHDDLKLMHKMMKDDHWAGG